MIYNARCPLCKSDQVNAAFSAEDYTVSHEHFILMRCQACTGLFTQDAPDSNDIGRYYASDNYISHSNTRRGLINRLYHSVRKRTLKSKRRLLQKALSMQTGTLLDVGCGTGAFLQYMQQVGWQVTGIEPDETARQNARTLHDVHPLAPHELFYLPRQSFDAITLWHVLEHVHELDQYMEQLKDLLKDNGRMFIAVPNYTSSDAAHYGAAWAAWDVPRHLYHFSPQSMRMLMGRFGLSVQQLKPMWYDAFYVSLLSEEYKGSRSKLKAFINGFRSNLRSIDHADRCSSVIYIISKNAGINSV